MCMWEADLTVWWSRARQFTPKPDTTSPTPLPCSHRHHHHSPTFSSLKCFSAILQRTPVIMSLATEVFGQGARQTEGEWESLRLRNYCAKEARLKNCSLWVKTEGTLCVNLHGNILLLNVCLHRICQQYTIFYLWYFTCPNFNSKMYTAPSYFHKSKTVLISSSTNSQWDI